MISTSARPGSLVVWVRGVEISCLLNPTYLGRLPSSQALPIRCTSVNIGPQPCLYPPRPRISSPSVAYLYYALSLMSHVFALRRC